MDRGLFLLHYHNLLWIEKGPIVLIKAYQVKGFFRNYQRPLVFFPLLIVPTIIALTPMLWMVLASLKESEDFFHYPFFMPLERFSLDNYRKLFDQIPFVRFFMNSLFVTGATVMIQLFFSSLGGFALAKYKFRGKKLVMLLMISTMMIPPQVLLAPLYELIFRMRLVDTYGGLIVPSMVSVFGLFLFCQAMREVPDDLLESGRIDGCSEFGLYWRLALPITRPMVGAFCLISFMGTWNNFLWPQIILQTQDRFTLPIALNQMVGLYKQDYGVLMAGTLLSVLPVAILFFALQREFMRGLTAGAVKG